MGEVPEGRRGTLSKRFVLSPSDPMGHLPHMMATEWTDLRV
jgi:hypothetical protein